VTHIATTAITRKTDLIYPGGAGGAVSNIPAVKIAAAPLVHLPTLTGEGTDSTTLHEEALYLQLQRSGSPRCSGMPVKKFVGLFPGWETAARPAF